MGDFIDANVDAVRVVKWHLDMCQLIMMTAAAVAPTAASNAMDRCLCFHHGMNRSSDAWDTVTSMNLAGPRDLVCIAIVSRDHLVVPSKISERVLRRRFSLL